MTDEEYRGLVLQHDKHIDKLALSIEHIAEAKWYLKPHYHAWAYTYYKSVRLMGKKFFHYRHEMKNMVDLVKEMGSVKGKE